MLTNSGFRIKLINIQHIRFSALTAVLLLSTVMLVTIDESQSSVFAQNVTSKVLPSQLPAQDSTSTPTTPASGTSNADETSSSSGLLTMATTTMTVTHNKIQHIKRWQRWQR